jgi:hypothetical protein
MTLGRTAVICAQCVHVYISVVNRRFPTFVTVLVSKGLCTIIAVNGTCNTLRIFERRILRKIFGPMQNVDRSWRIRMNYELINLIGNADIVRLIKSRRIAWFGHVMRMDGKRTPKRMLQWKPICTRTWGRPRKRRIVALKVVIKNDRGLCGCNLIIPCVSTYSYFVGKCRCAPHSRRMYDPHAIKLSFSVTWQNGNSLVGLFTDNHGVPSYKREYFILFPVLNDQSDI